MSGRFGGHALSLTDAFTILCDVCEWGIRMPGSSLCRTCQNDFDATYATLPGAES